MTAVWKCIIHHQQKQTHGQRQIRRSIRAKRIFNDWAVVRYDNILLRPVFVTRETISSVWRFATTRREPVLYDNYYIQCQKCCSFGCWVCLGGARVLVVVRDLFFSTEKTKFLLKSEICFFVYKNRVVNWWCCEEGSWATWTDALAMSNVESLVVGESCWTTG